MGERGRKGSEDEAAWRSIFIQDMVSERERPWDWDWDGGVGGTEKPGQGREKVSER